MRRKRTPVAFMVVLAIALGLGVLIFILNGEGNYDWSRLYTEDAKQPYSSDILYRLMQVRVGEQRFVEVNDSLQKVLRERDSPLNDTYVFIGNTLFADGKESHALREFIRRGNTAFLLVEGLETRVFDSLLVKEKEDGAEELIFNDETLSFEKTEPPLFVSFDADSIELRLEQNSEYSCSLHPFLKWKPVKSVFSGLQMPLKSSAGSQVEVLGKAVLYTTSSVGNFNETNSFEIVNFIKVPLGEGTVYVHTVPLVFANLPLQNDTVMRYAQAVFSQIGDGVIFWDRANRLYDFNAFGDDTDRPSQEGPLEFILSKPALKYAWYTLLASGFLYLLFGARRRQRAVPIKKPLQNSSIEYAEAIARLFMEEKDHDKLIVLKMDIFKAFLRDRYGVKFSKDFPQMTEKELQEIHERSGIALSRVQQLFADYLYLSSIVGVNTPQMTSLHHQIEYFLANCK